MAEEHNEPYFTEIRRLLPDLKLCSFSFISHQMVFHAKVLKKLKSEIATNGAAWFTTILNTIERTVLSPFSEYELYGNYIANRFPELVMIEHSLNKSYASYRINTLHYIRLKHPLSKSISFHSR